ncbi:GIY-YIG nuclease family protein [Jannaschia sp. W003]|uniref:GIY-YIG nuclease family protein n=1 Tax=Jannaschia sp. W003 TaxID=2867012 RepID=UPI0021A2F3EB|nr:GIY-YIG nuclease family protein [Jannaschia sp. W003]UWQ22377.1 GIY-YIG nuclease family protein [Jannaschia sp. W003]
MMDETSTMIPTIWLRSFFGFDPAEDGYCGWTKEAARQNMLGKASPGDLFLIYGTDTTDTRPDQRRQALGLLQVDPIAIMDRDKCSPQALHRKAEHGWAEKWTFAIPVRRAWRIDRQIDIRYVAPETYRPERARAIAAWSEPLASADVDRLLQLPVTELPVWGEPPLPATALNDAPLREHFIPSRGVPLAFGSVSSDRRDGEHRLYVATFDGDARMLLGPRAGLKHDAVLVKVGMTNDPKRRLTELNAGFPPSATARWKIEVTSAPYPDGASALNAETDLKARLAKRETSQGGEFFTGKQDDVLAVFYGVPGVARSTITV